MGMIDSELLGSWTSPSNCRGGPGGVPRAWAASGLLASGDASSVPACWNGGPPAWPPSECLHRPDF